MHNDRDVEQAKIFGGLCNYLEPPPPQNEKWFRDSPCDLALRSLFDFLKDRLSNGYMRLDEFVEPLSDACKFSIEIAVDPKYDTLLTAPYNIACKQLCVCNVVKDRGSNGCIVLLCEPIQPYPSATSKLRNLGKWM